MRLAHCLLHCQTVVAGVAQADDDTALRGELFGDPGLAGFMAAGAVRDDHQRMAARRRRGARRDLERKRAEAQRLGGAAVGYPIMPGTLSLPPLALVMVQRRFWTPTCALMGSNGASAVSATVRSRVISVQKFMRYRHDALTM